MGEIKIYDANDLDRNDWRQLQSISRSAFAETLLDRNLGEIDELIEWRHQTSFYESHIDPNVLVGTRYNESQSYTRPRVAVAIEEGEAVGFAYSAHNVSGETERQRLMKRLSIVKNYLWLREVAVSPRFQGQGMARELAVRLLRDANPLQPPTAYVWPDVIGFMQGALERVGFVATGEQDVEIFGEGSVPVKQVRLQASSTHSVLKKLEKDK